MNQRIENFTDLVTWREAHKLVVNVYTTTKMFPREEVYGLTSQMRRAAISITSNIAEGFSRRTAGEKAQFYGMAKGSLTEIQNQLYAARDIGYLSTQNFESLHTCTIQISKLLTGLARSTKNQ